MLLQLYLDDVVGERCVAVDAEGNDWRVWARATSGDLDEQCVFKETTVRRDIYGKAGKILRRFRDFFEIPVFLVLSCLEFWHIF